MSIITCIRRIGGTYYMKMPSSFCKEENIKTGDYFEIESDVITKNTYNLRKIGSDNGKVSKSAGK